MNSSHMRWRIQQFSQGLQLVKSVSFEHVTGKTNWWIERWLDAVTWLRSGKAAGLRQKEDGKRSFRAVFVTPHSKHWQRRLRYATPTSTVFQTQTADFRSNQHWKSSEINDKMVNGFRFMSNLTVARFGFVQVKYLTDMRMVSEKNRSLFQINGKLS